MNMACFQSESEMTAVTAPMLRTGLFAGTAVSPVYLGQGMMAEGITKGKQWRARRGEHTHEEIFVFEHLG